MLWVWDISLSFCCFYGSVYCVLYESDSILVCGSRARHVMTRNIFGIYDFAHFIWPWQAALGESKDKSGKGNARVVLKVQVDDSEVVLGTLSEGKCDQMPLDLVFDREFTVSHNSSSSSVYICGYRTEGPEYDDSEGAYSFFNMLVFLLLAFNKYESWSAC